MYGMLLTAAVAVVCLIPAWTQNIRPRSFCNGNDIIPDGDDCATRYTRCDDGIFISGLCPGDDMAIGSSMRCERRPECARRNPRNRPQRRGKRQASSQNGCPQFDCPNNLIFYIYPDWDDCTRFFTCSEGNIDVVSCSDFNFQYYNPNLFSCEVDLSFGPVTPQNNVCVNRATSFGK